MNADSAGQTSDANGPSGQRQVEKDDEELSRLSLLAQAKLPRIALKQIREDRCLTWSSCSINQEVG